MGVKLAGNLMVGTAKGLTIAMVALLEREGKAWNTKNVFA